MKGEKSKISKARGVEICVELQYSGKSRKEILQEITESYKASEKTVDNWMKEARPIVAERQREAEVVRRREDEALIAESARKLNITREWVLEKYYQLANYDPREAFTIDGGFRGIKEIPDDVAMALGGIEAISAGESEDGETSGSILKLKFLNRKDALDSICKVMGYNAPEKKEIKTDVTLSELPITFK